MSLLSFWNSVNVFSTYLFDQKAKRRQFILSCEGERLALPVTPSTYKVDTAQNNPTIDIIDFGEAQLFGNPKLKRISFSCFFPQSLHEYPFVVGEKEKEPDECVTLIEKWKEGKKPVRLIITESPVNLMTAIKNFVYKEKDGSRDIYYELSLVEWKNLNTPSANNDKEVDEDTGLKKRPQEKQKTKLQRARDALEASKKAYGDFKHWRGMLDHRNWPNMIAYEARRRVQADIAREDAQSASEDIKN